MAVEGEDAAVTFYTHTLCPYAHRVALCLAEKRIPHHRVHVDLSNKPSWFLELNRRGLVPALQVRDGTTKEGEVRTESIPLCYWLDESFCGEGHPSLVPAGAKEGEMRRLVDAFDGGFISAGLQFVGGGWGFSRAPHPAGSTATGPAARLAREVAAVEAAIAAHGGGPYLMGPEVSLADLVLYPFVERFELAAREFRGCELSEMGRGGDPGTSGDTRNVFGGWMAAMAARESVAALRPKDEAALLASWRRTMRLDYFDYETADADNP